MFEPVKFSTANIVDEETTYKLPFVYILLYFTLIYHLLMLGNPLAQMIILFSWFFKEVASEIATPLTSLFNYSLQHNIVPLAWKISYITLINKGGPLMTPLIIGLLPLSLWLLKFRRKFSSYSSASLKQNNLLHPHQ